MKRLILFLLILLFLLLAGCINETVYIDSTPAANGTLAVAATENSLFAQRSTMTASVRQTEVMREILQATMVAEQVRATQAAQALQLTLGAENAMQTSTAAVQQAEYALNVTRTSAALVEISNQIAYQAQQQQIDIQRRRILNTILGVTMFLVILGFLSALGWGFWQFLRASMARRMPAEPQLSQLMLWDRNGRLVVIDPARGSSPQIVETSFSRPGLPAASHTHAMAHIRAENIANVEETRRFHQRPEIPAVASWRRVSEDWQGGALPLGMSTKGMITIHTDINPHVLLAGTAGSGKTRFAMRPLAAAALADGWQVVILGRENNHYTHFHQHHNASLLSLDDAPAEAVIRYLSRMYQKIRRRVDELEDQRIQTWGDRSADSYRTLVLIDDFQDVITGITSLEKRNEMWQLARSITAEGHRAGIHLMIAIQDPSYTDLDLRIRRYMSPVTFRVSETLISRVVLNTDGAEELYPRQFMAILNDDLVFGFAFAPDDSDILRFLDNRPQPPLPAPVWLIEP
jgi:hypothetical protein